MKKVKDKIVDWILMGVCTVIVLAAHADRGWHEWRERWH